MQQRQPRLGDILDDYCPRERRLTNHAVVAMIGDEVKQTRCTTCESEHEYKHARLPRQRRKPEQSALYSQVLAHVAPKKIVPPPNEEPAPDDAPVANDVPYLEALEDEAAIDAHAEGQVDEHAEAHLDERLDAHVEVEADAGVEGDAMIAAATEVDALFQMSADERGDEVDGEPPVEEGPAHRRLIRAQLPRHDGQVTTARQGPDFTIRQPNNPRGNRFRPRQQRSGGAQFQGNRGGTGSGNGHVRGGAPRPNGRTGQGGQRGPGRNRSK